MVKSKYENRKPVCDFLIDGNSNVSSIVNQLCDIHCWNVPQPLEWNKVRFKYANRQRICDFPFVGNSKVCLICHRLQDNHVWSSHCTWFQILTLKMKVMGVGDFNEIWHRNLLCQRAHVCMCARTRVHVCACACVRAHVCMCARVHVCAHTCACVRVCMCARTRVHVCEHLRF